MPREEMFIDGHLLHADNTYSRIEFDYLIDKQKWISVRQYLLDRYRVENWHNFNKMKTKKPGKGNFTGLTVGGIAARVT